MKERDDCVNRIIHDQSIDSKHHILIDVCEVTNSPSPDDLPLIVSLIEILQSKFKGRVAILNTRVGHVTFTHLITLSACCGDNVQAFQTENEAREWLCAGT
jgi:hypothetical protein